MLGILNIFQIFFSFMNEVSDEMIKKETACYKAEYEVFVWISVILFVSLTQCLTRCFIWCKKKLYDKEQ